VNQHVRFIEPNQSNLIQAELGKFSRSTIERKQLSTKTTFKRIALVAVAALTLGSFSAVSASAANSSAVVVNSINLTTVTAAPTTGAAVAVNVGASVATQTLANATDSFDLVGAITSFPTGGNAGVAAALTTGAGATATKLAAPFNGTYVAAGSSLTVQAASATSVTANAVTSSATVGMGSFSFTPSVAGTYVLTVFQDKNQDGIIGATDVSQTVSITVVAAAAAAALSQSYSTVHAVAGNGTSAADATTDAAGISASRAIVVANAGALTISAKNASNAAITTVTVAASISGVGLIRVGTLTDNAPTADVCNSGGVRSVAATAADAVNTLYVCADGNAGTGTITVTITDTVSLAVATFTKTVTFYGAVASYKATAKKVVVGASAPSNGAQTTAAVEVIAYDAAGIIVPAQTAYFTSSDTAKIAGAATFTTSTVANATATPSVATLDLTVANSATADRYGDVTLTIQPSSTVTTPSTTVVVSLAKVEADSYTLATDAEEYTPGAKVTFTLTRKDATRAPAGSTSGALSWTSNLGYTGTMAVDVAASLTGVDTWSVFAPSTPGVWTLTGTLVSGAAWSTALDATTFTKSITVTGGATESAAQAAADAAAEATDAANAATDAANAAAEAADAATAAAQDAADAVAALSTQVSEMINALKKQITALTNLVIKIQKKVKA